MFQSLILLSLISLESPYSFEVDRGPILEIVGAANVQDSSDDIAAGGGARASWSFANIQDAFFSLELDFSYQRIFDDRLDQQRLSKNKYLLGANIVFYETYQPFAFRVALGGGVERRFKEYSGAFNYRGGLGWYLTSDWALWGDLIGHNYFRKGSRSDTAIDLSLALQYIF